MISALITSVIVGGLWVHMCLKFKFDAHVIIIGSLVLGFVIGGMI